MFIESACCVQFSRVWVCSGWPKRKKKENCVNIFDFQDPSEDQEVAVMAKWPTDHNFFFLTLTERGKTKNPKKNLQNTKILKYC